MNRSRPRKTYLWICLACVAAAVCLVYFATGRLVDDASLHDLSCALDRRIPFLPEWVTVYFLAYPFWIIGGALIFGEGPERAFRMTAAFLLAMAASGALFIAWPGTIERPEPAGNGFFLAWVRLLYRIDPPKNLCPSMHVLNSYYCWRGLWGCKRVSAWVRRFAFLFLVLVCLSVLFVKQHALVDIPVAVVIAEATLRLGGAFPRRWIPAGWRESASEASQS